MKVVEYCRLHQATPSWALFLIRISGELLLKRFPTAEVT